MKIKLGIVTLSVLFASANAAALTLPFDAAYTVAASGSTTPVSVFDIDGPAPWLFVDLPRLGSLLTFVSSNWLRDGNATLQFSAFPLASSADQFWLAPSAVQWNATKAPGAWHIDATFSLVGLQCAESCGIGVGVDEGSGSTTVQFTVAAVPLPATAWLFACALGAVGFPRARRARGARCA
jgi:hypothetical protein